MLAETSATKIWISPAPAAMTPRDCRARQYKARISGSGTADVLATDSLDVQISGSGTVTYSGNPKVQQDISGSGRLIKK